MTMVVEFTLEELEKALRGEFHYLRYMDVRLEKLPSRVYAVVLPPKSLRLVIPSKSVGDLIVYERGEGRYGASLRDLNDFIRDVVECGRKMEAKCAKLVEALRKLCEEGDEDG